LRRLLALALSGEILPDTERLRPMLVQKNSVLVGLYHPCPGLTVELLLLRQQNVNNSADMSGLSTGRGRARFGCFAL